MNKKQKKIKGKLRDLYGKDWKTKKRKETKSLMPTEPKGEKDEKS